MLKAVAKILMKLKTTAVIEGLGEIKPTPDPLELIITMPTEGQEFDEGGSIVVSFSFNRSAPEVTKTELRVNGTLSQTDSTPPFPASFVLTDLPAGAITIEVLAFEGSTEIASATVNIVVEALPFFVTINEPTEAQTFTEGDDIVVGYSFSRVNGNVTKKELWVNGAVVDSQTGSTPSPFTISSATEGAKEIEVRIFEGAAQVASDVVNVTVEAVAATLLLDLYPNSSGESWSLEQINSNFTGNILELRRDDNDTMLVQFDAGVLPQAAIAAWAGSGKAYVTKWNGQSGNNLFVQQTNAANQPWIYDNGFTLEGGKPSMIFAGNQYLDGGDILGVGVRPLISFVVGQGLNDYFYAKSIAGNQEQRYGLFYDGGTISVLHPKGSGSNNNISYAHTNARKIISQMVIPNVEHKVFENNVEKGSVSPLSGDGLVGDSDYDFLIGAYNDGNGSANPPYACLGGTIQAIHIYLNDVSAQRSAITTEIMNRYGIS